MRRGCTSGCAGSAHRGHVSLSVQPWALESDTVLLRSPCVGQFHRNVGKRLRGCSHRTSALQLPPLFQADSLGPQGRRSGKLRDDQRFWSLLPPTRGRATDIEQLADGLWMATQPLLLPGGDAGLRLTAMRMSNGNLWVHNPVAPTGEVLAALRGMGGPVLHIVVPNNSPEHWYFLGRFAQQFPEATVWVPPGFFAGRRTPFPSPGLKELRNSGRVRIYGDGSPAEWNGDVSVALLNTPLLQEGAFVLKCYRTLLVSDNLLMSDEKWSPSAFARFISKRLGVWQRLGPFFLRILDRNPEVSSQWARAVLEFEFDTVIPSHLAAPVRDGRAAFAACFPQLAAEQPATAPAGQQH